MSALAAAAADNRLVAASGPTLEIHATCVEFHGRGILLRGPSGAGKSDLALRLIAAGADLVADDRVVLEPHGHRLRALARSVALLPPGLIELRAQGIVSLSPIARTRLALVVDLAAEDHRLPDPETTTLLGVELPLVTLDPRPASAVARLAAILLARREA